MADNVNVTPGTGVTVLADEVTDGTLGTGIVQLVKIVDATLGGTTKAAVGANGLAADVKAVVPGTGATNLGKAEDAAHTSGDVGVMLLTVRQDSATALPGTEGDYAPLITNNNGRLHVVMGPSENLLGLIGSSDLQVAVTPTIQAAAYGAGDVIFDVTAIANAARVSGGVCILQSLTVVDKSDNTAAAMTVHFFATTGTFGTANSAPSMSDADIGANYQGHVVIAAADWVDYGGAKVACAKGIGLAMKPAATTLYFAATTAGTPTYGATSDLVFQFTFLRS